MSRLRFTKMAAAPSAPSVNKIEVYTNTNRRLVQIDENGTISGLVGSWMNVKDYGIVGDGSTDDLAALNALMTSAPDASTIFFPPGTYKISGTIAIPSGKHFRFLGSGEEKSILSTSSATLDMITCGDWYSEFRYLKFTSSVTRTAGACINSGNNVGINVFQCDFLNVFNGIVYTGGANAGNLATVENCDFAGTVNFGIKVDGTNANSIITGCTMDGVLGTQVAGLELTQCGSLLVTDCDFIRAQNNLRFNPTSPNGVFAVYCTNVFFDNSSGSAVKITGTGNVQRLKFVNCWFTTGANSTTAFEIASTAALLPTAIDVVNCDFYNTFGATSSNGILVNGCQEVSISHSRIAGWTTGISTVASASAVTKLNIIDNFIGATGNIAANGTGISIAAGTYGNYIIEGNIITGNTTAPITDSGSVTGQNQKKIDQNVGDTICGIVSATIAASAAINTTETIVAGGLNLAPFPANSVRVGDTFRITLLGTCTSSVANVSTFRLHWGTAGTISDAIIASQAITAAATGTTIPFKFEFIFTVRTLGSTGTIFGTIVTLSQGLATGTSSGLQAFSVNTLAPTFFALLNTTTANYMSLSYQSAAATTTCTFQNGIIEKC